MADLNILNSCLSRYEHQHRWIILLASSLHSNTLDIEGIDDIRNTHLIRSLGFAAVQIRTPETPLEDSIAVATGPPYPGPIEDQ